MKPIDSDALFNIVKGMYEESCRYTDDESVGKSKALWNVLNEIADAEEIVIDAIPIKWILYKIKHLKDENNSNTSKNYEQLLRSWHEDKKLLEALGMDICDLYVNENDSEEENDEDS